VQGVVAKDAERRQNTGKRFNYYHKDGPYCFKRKKWGDLGRYIRGLFGDFDENDIVSHNDVENDKYLISPMMLKVKSEVKCEIRRPNVLKERIFTKLGRLGMESYSHYLYSINITSALPQSENSINTSLRICPPEKSHHRIGILVPNEMPPIPKFPVYTKSGEMFVSIESCNDRVRLTKEQWDLALKFHEYTFSTFLNIVEFPMIFSPNFAENSLIVVPLSNEQKDTDGFEIDWIMLNTVEISVSMSQAVSLEFSSCDYEDKIIMPRFIKQTSPQYGYVLRTCSELDPTSAFPSTRFESYESYYSTEFDVKIHYLKQPLLETCVVSEHLNALKRRDENRRGLALPSKMETGKDFNNERGQMPTLYNVPELCNIHPFPPSLWQQCFYLPSILYRLDGLVIADELRETIANGINRPNGSKYEKILKEIVPRYYQWETLKFERASQNDPTNNSTTNMEVSLMDTEDHSLVKSLENTVPQQPNSESSFSFDAQTNLIDFPGPSPALILQSITAAKSEDAFDLER
jgi:endoribonuclease Dicer